MAAGTTITLSGSSSGCKAHQYAFDDTVYHVAGHLQGKPYWSHRVQYYVYWSDEEGDNLAGGQSRWYLDDDTENDRYFAHSSTISRGRRPTGNGGFGWAAAPPNSGRTLESAIFMVAAWSPILTAYR